MALSQIQQRVLRIFASVDEAGLFALAGGGAINVLEVSDRQSHDLDLFTPDAEQVNLLGERLESALVAEGMQVAVVRNSPGFMRLQVDDVSESTLVDLAQDARWLEPVSTQLGLVLDIRELAADKLCALFGRAKYVISTTSRSCLTCSPLKKL